MCAIIQFLYGRIYHKVGLKLQNGGKLDRCPGDVISAARVLNLVIV